MIKEQLSTALIWLLPCMPIAAQTTETSSESATTPNILRNGIFNHIDFAVTGGTSGFGFEFATPVTEWTRLRAGGVFRPLKHETAKFGIEVAENLDPSMNSQRFNKLADMMQTFNGYRPKSVVEMEGDLSMNNFKFLVDVFPFKNNRHWYVTVGFYYGNGTLIEAKNKAESMNTLTAIATYNNMYKRVLENKSPIDMSSMGINLDELEISQIQEYKNKLRKWGSRHNDEKGNAIIETEVVKYEYDHAISGQHYDDGEIILKKGTFAEHGISIPIGRYAHDVIAQEDIYYDYTEKLYQELNTGDINPYHQNLSIDINADEYHYQKDANGRYIKKGEIRYKKGEVIHREGEEFRMIPDADNIVKATARASKFKPYIGIGYETSINKDKRFNVGVDAGIMFWGNHPSVDVHTPIGINADGETIYMTYDISRDITNLKGNVKDYVNAVKQFPVFPEISARISYRLW